MANPYASPFGNTSALRAKAARDDDMDEDDDLKVNSSRPQSAFAQFKKLSAAKPKEGSRSRTPRKKAEPGWSLKRSKREKKELNRSRSRNKKDSKKKRQRANSLPRNAPKSNRKSNAKSGGSSGGNDKDDYIYFHNLADTKKDSTERPSLGTKTNQLEALNVETSNLDLSKSKQLKFDSLSNSKSTENGLSNQLGDAKVEVHTASYRSIRIPSHRMIHVRRMWADICKPVVKHLKLQIRMNSHRKIIELRTVSGVVEEDPVLKGRNAIQKGSDFVRAAVMGFELKDALALVRLDDIYLETFDIREIKFFNKKADHWMRAIGRIAGQYGKIKYSIENATNSRIIVFGFKVHILGSFSSIRLARNSISRLVIGSAPGNVYAKLRTVSSRLKHRF